MYKTISNKIIRKFNPCYDPSEVITDENEELSVKQWVEKYKNIVPPKDILWLLCRNEFLSDKDLRLFAVWCAREALKLVENPDKRSVNACNVAERYANGEATKEELETARSAAYVVYVSIRDICDAASYAAKSAWYAAHNAAHASDAALNFAHAAAYYAYYADSDAYYTAYDAAFAMQLIQLLGYF
jgi:hypothetical protein